MEIQQLEILCKQLYEATDSVIRSDAEKALVAFVSSQDALPKCQMLLERADSSYAQLLAATTLTKLIQGLNLEQRIDIRSYVLNYLANRPNLQHFVVQALVTLLAKITKYGWFDMYKSELIFQNLFEDVKKFLQGSVEHCTIGVQILSQLVLEMNSIIEVDVNLTFSKNRKIATSFRDQQLYDIFLLSCSLLVTARDNSKNLNFMDESQQALISHVLRLTKNCLSFDFIGSSTDESSDDMNSVQIPTSWRPAFLDSNTLKLFFDLYQILPNGLASYSLSCLVQMTSVRRSLFNNSERTKFLTHLVEGVKNILMNLHGLSDPDNYHEFCRLLARLKSNYQLGELIAVPCYPEAIQLIAKFTVQSLQMWQFAPNSVHYLLTLWQRMVASVPYVKSPEPHLLGTYTPEVTKAYIESRLDAVPVIVRDNMEDPLDDLCMVQQQLEQLSVIERCEYDKTCTLLVQHFDQKAREYENLLQTPNANPMDITVHELQLTWLVYIIGSAIVGRLTVNSNDDHDTMDAELVIRVLQLMSLTDARLPQAGCEKLELAVLSFLEQVRKMHITEQTQKANVYKRLSEVFGLNDEQMLLSFINRKIITNLKFWGHSEQIITKTLMLLSDLSVHFNSVRKLAKLEEVQFMLTHHTSEHFPFLGTNSSLSEMRCRTMFYTSLGRLLMFDLGEDEERFYNFLTPLTNQFESLGTVLMDSNSFPNEEAKKAIIGLARDLRGLAQPLNARIPYTMLFEWLYYADYLPILIRAVELWAHDPAVTTPVLKLFAELVHCRTQRLQGNVSSPMGILLFREASKLICIYGNRILHLDVPRDQQYPMRLKGISICFLILKNALGGNYVNFGVFKLYGDDTLDNVLNIAAKLIMSIQQNDLLEYPKLSSAYYGLLNCLSQDHITFLAGLEPRAFVYILESLSKGLSALDSTIYISCCSILDSIVSYIFKQLQLKVSTFPNKKLRNITPENVQFLEVVEMNSDLLQNMMSTLLNNVMAEDCRNQWSMSRPLLVLILLYEDYFRSLKDNIIRSQPLDKQQTMAQWFDDLMVGIERNVSSKNKEKFTQNLSSFRRDVVNLPKSSSYNTVNVISSVSDINDFLLNELEKEYMRDDD
ncbi:ran-binding protein 16 isoform X1 [Bactrocera neohumeralis]|uniref:Ran-binding protein 16 isoform X1 n=2 Tax=Bactrocera dorsalis TaxID=27457 RepID=A0A6I9VQM6_BACDO|nr:ran-binding protein 16 isoform X1 [Bactrocera dorsalis]XP_039959022.1 ran-binding protein 16 isoform X1 [Bactrocera tryoni]XP_049317049.1 ran-binding protein 16 isoform X1 [Bactrocera dorsalis]XP_050328304.1 ran-binding protein 16 isoform X1 [Bactrocera neohumeralis]